MQIKDILKKVLVFVIIFIIIGLISSCGTTSAGQVPESFDDAKAVEDYLLAQNEYYVASGANSGDVSADLREDTAENGQSPYAVVITCSDSRVPAEHIFDAGIGELFVIRTAGNVIGDYELGSVEYGAEHLHAKLVVVLGHTQCGAVDAALNGGAHGHIEDITDEIIENLPANCDARTAEILNVKNSINEIMESHMMQGLVNEGKVVVRGAIYDISTGKVEFLED